MSKPNLNKKVSKKKDLTSLTTKDPTDQERENKDIRVKDINKEEVVINPDTTKEERKTKTNLQVKTNKTSRPHSTTKR